jgi:hypothetical protein
MHEYRVPYFAGFLPGSIHLIWFIIDTADIKTKREGYMRKTIVAVVLIVLAAGTWGYLDYLNRQELQGAEELRQSLVQAHAQALARAKAAAEAKAKFEAQILAELTACKASAANTNEDFLTQNRKPVRRKPGQFTIPKSALDEAARTLEAANAACQTNYDTRLRNGS